MKRLAAILLVLALGGASWAGEPLRPPYPELTFLFTSAATLPGEIRGVEARCVCGRIVAIDEWIEYANPAGHIQSFAFDPRQSKLYFTRPGSGAIWVVHFSPAGPLPAWVLYRHAQPVVDLALRVEGGRSVLYFSTAGSGRGTIYRLLPGGVAEEAVAIGGDPAHFHWDGFFAFDPEGALYLSSGGRLPGRLWRWGEKGPTEVARIPGRRIGGFVFLDPWVVLLADLDGGVWKLDLREGDPVEVYRSRGRFRISDVVLYPSWWDELWDPMDRR
ncbi:hypothetical protein LR090_07045 [Candidatus Bipolaricaulota bacterium]|nr:hypothetical protein [Candidatus Bipolaricaulota bacterium]